MAAFATSNLRIERSSEHFSMLLLDVAEKSVNVFNRQVFADLDAALDHLAADASLQLLGIRSAKLSKPIAGADLNAFTAIKSPEEAIELSALGQRLFAKLADLKATTIIVIHGPCLGGGLEFALACDYRLVIDHPKTQLGLPEVELGLIPGWGGSQRLPRRVGIERALSVILGGRRLSARDALRWGLADGIAAGEADLADALRKLGHVALRQGKRPAHKLPLRTWRQRLLESNPLGRLMLFRGAERILRRRVPDDMPAPAEAIEAVRTGFRQGMDAGLAYEREASGRLMITTACRNLIGLFFLREQARKLPAKPAEGSAKIRRVGVVGAGVMGAGIAQLAAVRGFDVVVQEVNEAALAAGMKRITELFQKAVERRLLTREEADQKLAAMLRTTIWLGFGDVDLVIEAVVEDVQLKQTVFHRLEQVCRPNAVLATNTSSLQVKQVQDGMQHSERIAGLHFFNPVHKMPLVEVVQSPATAGPVVELCWQWAIEMGKTPVVVKDSPGFVVNRILMPYLDEAVRLVAEGMPIARIDKAMKRFGMPMGPLELLDEIGLDVAAHVARSMTPSLGSRFPPNTAFEKMSERGWLGVKADVGFYHHVRGGKNKVNAKAEALLREGRPPSDAELTKSLPAAAQIGEARERLVLLMLNEAAACLAEGLAADADAIDLAMVLGTGWAPHRGGPLHYLKDRGVREVVQAIQALAERLGPRFEPCKALRDGRSTAP